MVGTQIWLEILSHGVQVASSCIFLRARTCSTRFISQAFLFVHCTHNDPDPELSTTTTPQSKLAHLFLPGAKSHPFHDSFASLPPRTEEKNRLQPRHMFCLYSSIGGSICVHIRTTQSRAPGTASSVCSSFTSPPSPFSVSTVSPPLTLLLLNASTSSLILSLARALQGTHRTRVYSLSSFREQVGSQQYRKDLVLWYRAERNRRVNFGGRSFSLIVGADKGPGRSGGIESWLPSMVVAGV